MDIRGAVATVRIVPRLTSPQVVVAFDVKEGLPSKIVEIEIEGNVPEELGSRVKKLVKRTKGDEASEEKIKELRRKPWCYSRSEGYLQASVRTKELVLSPDIREIHLVLTITPRAPVSIFFVGNRFFSDADLLSPLKIETRKVPFTPHAIGRLCREIEKLYQLNGYAFAKARSTKMNPDGPRKRYRIDIVEGARVRVDKVEFQGNKSVRDKELKGNCPNKGN